jgi:hypothetical protein
MYRGRVPRVAVITCAVSLVLCSAPGTQAEIVCADSMYATVQFGRTFSGIYLMGFA